MRVRRRSENGAGSLTREGLFDIPSSRTGGEQIAGFLKEQVLFFALDHDGIAVAAVMAAERGRGSEILDGFDLERPSVQPCDGARQHIPRGIKVGIYLDIDFYIVLHDVTSENIKYLLEQMYYKIGILSRTKFYRSRTVFPVICLLKQKSAAK